MGLTTCFYFIHSLPWRLFIVNNKNYENKNFLCNNTYSFAENVVGYIYLYRKCPATGERYRAKKQPQDKGRQGRQGDGSFVSLGRSVCQDRRTVPLSLIGPATLTAIFDISGRTAMATDAEITGSGQNGWTYDYGTTRLSGNKAYGTACFKSGSTTKSMTLTLTCSPDGAIS